jgi:hypothetical protein
MADTRNKIDGVDTPGAVAGNLADNFSIVSLKPNAKYASGARTTLKINNQIIGFAFSVSWNIRTTVTEIRTIDSYFPHELAPKHIIVDGTMGMFHIPGRGLSSELIQADILNFLQQKYIAIEVRDSATDNLLFASNKVIVTGRAETLNSEQLGRINVSWQAIGWQDERSPAKPKEPSSGASFTPIIAEADLGQRSA